MGPLCFDLKLLRFFDVVLLRLMRFPRCVSQGQKLKETLLPSLNLLIESSRIHRETRKFLRSKVITGIIHS